MSDALWLLCRNCAASSPASGSTWRCGCGASLEREAGIWRVAVLEPAGFGPHSRAHLASFEEGHFWFEARERLVLAQLDRVRVVPKRMIDLGCGSGRLLAALDARGTEVVGVDAYAESLVRALDRVRPATLLQADVSAVPLHDGSFDLVTALDVLEHVEPVAFLREARRLLRPDGHLLLTVPAFPSLWSDRDRAAGHRKRYRRRDLAAELADHGFAPVTFSHYQFLLFPLLWLSRRLDARRERPLERSPPALLGRLLGAVNQCEVAWWGRRTLPWGSSLIVVARRAGPDGGGASA